MYMPDFVDCKSPSVIPREQKQEVNIFWMQSFSVSSMVIVFVPNCDCELPPIVDTYPQRTPTVMMMIAGYRL